MKTSTAQFILNALVSMSAVAAGLVLYDRTVVRPALLIGVVDVGEVYRAKDAEFTQILIKTALEEDRQKAVLMARSFAQRLPLALEELPRDCKCLVLLKGAIAGSTPNTLDLTPLLRTKVGSP